jgi:hypothetical protein
MVAAYRKTVDHTKLDHKESEGYTKKFRRGPLPKKKKKKARKEGEPQ